MGLLDGDLANVVGSVFSPLLLDATVHIATKTEDGKGGHGSTYADRAVKAMEKKHSAAYRAKAGIPAKDINVLVMQSTSPEDLQQRGILAGDHFTIRGERYKAREPLGQDAARAAWDIWLTPVKAPTG